MTMTQPFRGDPLTWICERGEILPTIRQRSKYINRRRIGKDLQRIHPESSKRKTGEAVEANLPIIVIWEARQDG